MSPRILVVLAFLAVILVSVPAELHASPDAPMCVADSPYATPAPIDLVRWRMPMCGPFAMRTPVVTKAPTEERAIAAYRRATAEIIEADYEEARLQLDLARRGLQRIGDRIDLQSGRLELLRRRPARAADFFAEAMSSPHQSVQVEAHYGRVFALIRADDPSADAALDELLTQYPQIPSRAELLYEQAQSLLRRQWETEAIAVMHTLRVGFPGKPAADWAESQLGWLGAAGRPVPTLTDEERVRQARRLIADGPLDDAKAAIQRLLEMPLSGELHAEVHYLAGKLARFEGRWRAAETYMRTAQLFPMPDPVTARSIDSRANDMSSTANARDRDEALRRLSAMRSGRREFAIPSAQLVDMIEVASAASLQIEVDAMLSVLAARRGLSTKVQFDAAMAAIGTGSDGPIAKVLGKVATHPYSRYRTAALYHLGRLHERAGRAREAELFLGQAQASAERQGDAYYALWAENGLRRVAFDEPDAAQEGFATADDGDQAPSPPARSEALAERLKPIADLHASSYPWLARAVDLLRIDERNAATEELFEAYLQWREAQGRPVARAGLDCVARADGRFISHVASDVRAARLELSEEERSTLSTVAASLGDVGTAGGFAGPDFIETLPRAYEWLVIPAAQRYGLDPNLLLAVMRVESAYQKHIVSYAGAVGLMQIMPRTGQLIAHALEHEDFTPADLLDPRVNLEFGAWYLASLINRFDGHLPLAIASYNGGPHNVRRWIQESAENTPLDVLLERIPFTQTHRYVRKVLVHYQSYRQQRELGMPQLSVVVPEPRVDPLAF